MAAASAWSTWVMWHSDAPAEPTHAYAPYIIHGSHMILLVLVGIHALGSTWLISCYPFCLAAASQVRPGQGLPSQRGVA